MSRQIVHPPWCGQAHLCTAEHGGEHASVPETRRRGRGRVVVTRLQQAGGQAYAELRIVVPLPAGEDQAQRLGGQLVDVALEMASAAGAVGSRR